MLSMQRIISLSWLTMFNIKSVMLNKNSSIFRNNSTDTKSGLNGVANLEGPNTSLEEAKNQLETTLNNYKQSIKTNVQSSQNFKELLNGFFQAEGTISASFVKPLSIKINPYFSMNQNYNAESLAFFVKIYYELGKVGKVSVYLNDYNKIMIRYRADGWTNFFVTFVPYFVMLHGDKFKAIFILKKVHELSSSSLNVDKLLIVKLIYSLSTSGAGRSISMLEKLELLNLKTDSTMVDMVSSGIGDNPQELTLYFFIGFFLGDGNLGLWPVWAESDACLVFSPRLTLVQLAKDSNIVLMNKIKSLLELYLNIDVLLYTANNQNNPNTKSTLPVVITMVVQGQHNVLELLLNLLAPHYDYLYWKKPQYDLLTWFKAIVKDGLHLQSFIIRIILKRLYEKSPNLQLWLERLDKLISKLESNWESQQLYIGQVKNRNTKEIQGWLVRFPQHLKLPTKRFIFSIYGSESKALTAAIVYRDSVIKELTKKYDKPDNSN